MSDIVERLRSKDGRGINLTLCAEAAAELTAARARIAELEKAIEPFSLEDGDYKGRDDDEAIGVFIRLGDFRRARAILKGN
jgi:hypothetical protein